MSNRNQRDADRIAAWLVFWLLALAAVVAVLLWMALT